MKKQTKVRLCLALLALASILGLEFTGSEATAAPCCIECDDRFWSCVAGTSNSECNGDYICCDHATRNCYLWCFEC